MCCFSVDEVCRTVYMSARLSAEVMRELLWPYKPYICTMCFVVMLFEMVAVCASAEKCIWDE